MARKQPLSLDDTAEEYIVYLNSLAGFLNKRRTPKTRRMSRRLLKLASDFEDLVIEIERVVLIAGVPVTRSRGRGGSLSARARKSLEYFETYQLTKQLYDGGLTWDETYLRVGEQLNKSWEAVRTARFKTEKMLALCRPR